MSEIINEEARIVENTERELLQDSMKTIIRTKEAIADGKARFEEREHDEDDYCPECGNLHGKGWFFCETCAKYSWEVKREKAGERERDER